MTKMDFFKKRMYEIIEASKDDDQASKAYDVMIFVAVIVSLIPLMLKPGTNNIYIKSIDIITIILFIFDYSARIFTSDYKMGIKSYKAYVAYAFTPMAIIDLLAIIPVLEFIFPARSALRLFRLFRILLLFKLVRYSKVMTNITNVLRKIKKQLLAVAIVTIIYILAMAMIMYQLETEIFDSFLDAIYWSTISITTIGYGDLAPVTDVGKAISAISALVGVAVIALPSGIITAGYMDEVKKKKSKLEL